MGKFLNNTKKRRRLFAAIDLRSDVVQRVLTKHGVLAINVRKLSRGTKAEGHILLCSSLKELKANQHALQVRSAKVVVSCLSTARTDNDWLKANSIDANACLPPGRWSFDDIDGERLCRLVKALPVVHFPCDVFPDNRPLYSEAYLAKRKEKDLERKRRRPKTSSKKKPEVETRDLRHELKYIRPTDANAPAFLRDLRWPRGSKLPACPSCGERAYVTYKFRSGRSSEVHGIRCKRCPQAKQLGPTSGTFLHGVKTEISEVYCVAHLFSKFPTKLKGKHLASVLGGFPATYERILVRFRAACAGHDVDDGKAVMILALRDRPKIGSK